MPHRPRTRRGQLEPTLTPRRVPGGRLAVLQLLGSVGEWRVRTGDYRIIYESEDKELLVLVLQVGHRHDVYERRR